MTIKNNTITKGFVIAGLMNLSVLIFSRFFTNTSISKFDPDVLSNFGLVMIIVWGLAYISVAKNFKTVKWLIAVFVIEKLIYGIVWIKWLTNNELTKVYNEDTLAGIFYTIYGLNDLAFCLFFLIVFLKLNKSNTSY